MKFLKSISKKLNFVSNRAFGNIGEDIAESFLIKNGYKILERNYSIRSGEIDIIAQKSDLISFIEVKTRTSTAYGLPEEAVNRQKQRYISRAARHYITRCANPDLSYSADIISIILFDSTTPQITHIQDAFTIQ